MHVRQARSADGERRGEEHRLVGLAGELGQAERDVDVGRDEHSGLVERAQETGRAGHLADVIRIALDRRDRHVGHDGAPPASRASLKAETSTADGCHENTPHRIPSTTGVSGPVIPRTNAYATPARLRSGS